MADINSYQDHGEDSLHNDGQFGDDLSASEEDDEREEEDEEILSPIQKLEKYMNSDNIFSRQMVARSMLDTLRAVGHHGDDCQSFLKAMQKLSQDLEPTVRSDLMEQVPHIAMYCHENGEIFQNVISEYILPMVVKYLDDGNSQVRKTSQAALLVLIEQELVEKCDIEEQVLWMILELANPESPDDYRTEAVALMSKMAPLLGQDLTESRFLATFCIMCNDPVFHVRKVCSANFGDMCTVVGEDKTEESLIPRFIDLCDDDVWGVRKACAECFMTVCQACSPKTRNCRLANLFINLLCDTSRWVRMAAFQALGPVISTFADPSLSGLSFNDDGSVIIDDSMRFSINLPDNTADQYFEAPTTFEKEVEAPTSTSCDQDVDEALTTTSCDNTIKVHTNNNNNPPLVTDGCLEKVNCDSNSISNSGVSSSPPQSSLNSNTITSVKIPARTELIDNLSPSSPTEQLLVSNTPPSSPTSKSDTHINHRLTVDDNVEEKVCLIHDDSKSVKCSVQGSDDDMDIDDDSKPEKEVFTSKVEEILLVGKSPEEVRWDKYQSNDFSQIKSVISSKSCDDTWTETSKSEIKENHRGGDSVVVPVKRTASRTISLSSDDGSVFSDVSTASGQSAIRTESSKEGHVRIHIDNVASFNNFQYWRAPLPELELDLDIVNGAPTNIHIKAKSQDEGRHKIYATEMDIKVSKSGDVEHGFSAATTTTDTDCETSDKKSYMAVVASSEMELEDAGLKIHTASVSTISEAIETVLNINSPLFDLDDDNLLSFDTSMSGLSGGHHRNSSLHSLMMSSNFLQDDASLSQQQNVIPHTLLEHYLGMVDPSHAEMVDTEITRHCAYSLPAVAFTLGRHNWPCLRQLYETLAQDIQWKVRRTLAFSLHELSVIVGDEITHSDLVPVFEGFLKDLDEVRIGVLRHLADFLRLLSPVVRQQYLTKLQDFLLTDNQRNWRFRLELASQLILLCELYSAPDISSYIVPIAMNLVIDKVAEVRQLSCTLMASIIQRLSATEQDRFLISLAADLLDKFALSIRWYNRQLYAQLCQSILSEKAICCELFAQYFLQGLLGLSQDAIPNVRITLGKTLAQWIAPSDYFTSYQNPHHQELLKVLQMLQTDSDRDVRHFASVPADINLVHTNTVPV